MKSVFTIALIIASLVANATVWQVGPSRTYTHCSQVVSQVQSGDTVEIDYANYINDPQVQWNQNNLYIAGIGGRPRIEAGSSIASDPTNGKGIFVITGDDVVIENIEFANAAVMDNNGAGIRHQGGNLTVRHCKFIGNQNGILSGNHANTTVIVEFSEFLNSGSSANPGFQHNIYINHIDSFVFRYNYSIDAIAEGHELKSRANHNFILYNRIANQLSNDSRTIDLPNGGTSVIVGNIIEQGPSSVNSNLVGFGLEGLSNPGPHSLYCASNTFINKKSNGTFVQVQSGTDTLYLRNNIMVGAKTGGLILGSPSYLDSSAYFVNNSVSSAGFVDQQNFNYHLNSSSQAIDSGTLTYRNVFGHSLDPYLMYMDSNNVEPRVLSNSLDIGAFEYVPPVGLNQHDPTTVVAYPVPAFDHLTLHSKEMSINSMRLIDMTGRIIEVENDVNSEIYTIALSTLREGYYFLKVILSDNSMTVIKFPKID